MLRIHLKKCCSLKMKLDNLHMCLIVATLLLVGIVIYLWITYYNRDGYRPIVQAKKSDEEEKIDSPTLVLFHGNWCTHCKNMMPAWEQCVQAIQEKTQGKIKTMAIESKSPEVANHNITGFPTVRMYPQGLHGSAPAVEYKGDRSAESLTNFALTGKQ